MTIDPTTVDPATVTTEQLMQLWLEAGRPDRAVAVYARDRQLLKLRDVSQFLRAASTAELVKQIETRGG